MKTLKCYGAQGDLLICRIEKLPENIKQEKSIEGRFIVAHSESGHHHVIAEKPGVEYFSGEDPMVAYLRVIDNTEVTLEHLRDFDTHESWLIKGGTYEILRSREYTPTGWRRTQD